MGTLAPWAPWHSDHPDPDAFSIAFPSLWRPNFIYIKKWLGSAGLLIKWPLAAGLKMASVRRYPLGPFEFGVPSNINPPSLKSKSTAQKIYLGQA